MGTWLLIHLKLNPQGSGPAGKADHREPQWLARGEGPRLPETCWDPSAGSDTSWGPSPWGSQAPTPRAHFSEGAQDFTQLNEECGILEISTHTLQEKTH